jgi:hypothetical protein
MHPHHLHHLHHLLEGVVNPIVTCIIIIPWFYITATSCALHWA